MCLRLPPAPDGTKGDNFDFLAEFLWRAESLPWLKRYSIFQFPDWGIHLTGVTTTCFCDLMMMMWFLRIILWLMMMVVLRMKMMVMWFLRIM